jgi:spore germination protein Q
MNEQSYIENILKLNKGKKVEVFMTFADSNEWRDRIFKGIIEETGKDHIILSDPTSGNWYLLFFMYVNFIKFEEDINISETFYPNI